MPLSSPMGFFGNTNLENREEKDIRVGICGSRKNLYATQE